MSKLFNKSLRLFISYAAIVLICTIPAYYFIIWELWKFELEEHNIKLTDAAGREDSYLIILAVTSLTIIFFILLLAGFIIINRRITTRLWKPFYQSLEQIRNFDLTRQDMVKFEPNEIDEFTELNTSLDRLIIGNINVFRQQKEFAENASHELQTPLAVIQSKLEMMLQSSELTKEQYDNIEETLMALGRVGRINKNLLLLTRIENSQFMEKETIDLSVLTRSIIASLSPIAESRQLQIQSEVEAGVGLDCNRTLAEIVLNNMITNAIRHGHARTIIYIRLTSTGLKVCNDGTHSLDATRLFQRFSTVSNDTPGTGLGLALIKQIANRYGWTAGYRFIGNQHVFSIRFL